MDSDLELAFHLVDLADAETARRWNSRGQSSRMKGDGTPVTEADIAAEEAMVRALRRARPADGFLGEEVGEHPGRDGRRWIADGIDGTRFFAAGRETWGTLLAATRGLGAFTARTGGSNATQMRVSARTVASPDRVACLPSIDALSPGRQEALEQLAGGRPVDHPWSHQNRVADGQVDLCIWDAGDIWDHAAPSIIVEEAGGRFTDHCGGSRLDTRTAVYSNGIGHEQVLDARRGVEDEP